MIDRYNQTIQFPQGQLKLTMQSQSNKTTYEFRREGQQGHMKKHHWKKEERGSAPAGRGVCFPAILFILLIVIQVIQKFEGQGAIIIQQ